MTDTEIKERIQFTETMLRVSLMEPAQATILNNQLIILKALSEILSKLP